MPAERPAPAAGPRPAAAAALPAPAPAPAAPPAPAPAAAVDPAAPFVVRRILPIAGPLHIGDWVWHPAGAPPGPLVITVDLDAMVLSAFRGGYEIGTAAILYGADSTPTPLGIFPITQKDRDHHSSVYNNAPMPYAMRLTGDGVFIHGAPMRIGGATHGCIGLPTAFAAKLFAASRVGDRVIITAGRRIGLGAAILPG
ncbi:L,D-transpeptidase family protein [Sphingomonas morindae]|uniref:L,D-transpeptidase family protein n=1 Tax=Sphingomonas morindae TaxID=1541170 RepID=A0ABY4X3M3_9SPHN|nr:L,D-transpeptidase family protein [Sphingomonas morindae]USI71460.1 L,D-transpeptidase family protein [Sphingomonas morindae]